MKLSGTLFIIAFVFTSLATVAQQNYNFSLYADFQNQEDTLQLKLMQLQQKNMKSIDNARAYPGRQFKLYARIDKAGFYQLFKDEKNYLILITEPGEEIRITADINKLNDPQVEGSPATRLFYEFLPKFTASKRQLDSLEMVFARARQSSNGISRENQNELVEAYRSTQQEQIEMIAELIREHPGKLTGLMFVDQLEMDNYFELLQTYAHRLHDKYPDNSFVSDFYSQVKKAEALAVGADAPDIALPKPDGDKLALSEVEGQVILIDFWASWCQPCRKANPHIVKLYNKYKDKGFEIYGVSLDKDRESWLAAIEKDSLTWHHVSDLKQWKSSAAQTYGVSSIPYTVLINAEGKIIAKGLREDKLESKLEEIFGE